MNLHGILAESVTAPETHNAAFAKSSVTPAEQQIIFLAINRVNECGYGISGHSLLAQNAGVDAPAVEGSRESTAIPDTQIAALRDFVTAVVDQKGHVGDAVVKRSSTPGSPPARA
ncbi:MAG: carboxymuconolactone decarboxylase family protein [Paracoccaceae bacterium]|nr:carboxymuconolactone decarboxylase family protein [Paracoccaceae bacterium]